jgi:hypothetical protein
VSESEWASERASVRACVCVRIINSNTSNKNSYERLLQEMIFWECLQHYWSSGGRKLSLEDECNCFCMHVVKVIVMPLHETGTRSNNILNLISLRFLREFSYFFSSINVKHNKLNTYMDDKRPVVSYNKSL